MGGKSSIAFSYRIVGRRKDIKEYRRFAKVDTRLPMPDAKSGPPPKPATTAAELHAFLARVQKEARERRPKGRRKGRRLRAPPKYVRPGIRLRAASDTKRTLLRPLPLIAIYEYTPFCNGPSDVKSPRVIITPPSSRFCPWLALRPPHYAVRRNGELI
jgi:hypothetical protein